MSPLVNFYKTNERISALLTAGYRHSEQIPRFQEDIDVFFKP